MEKLQIETEITDETIFEGYGEDNSESRTYAIDVLIKYLNDEKSKGANRVTIQTNARESYGSHSFYTHLITTNVREETDEEINLRIKQEQEENQRALEHESYLKQQQEAKEKQLFLKLKQKFEK
jgi:hypothetical protein